MKTGIALLMAAALCSCAAAEQETVSAAGSQRVPGAVRHLRPECRKPMEEHRLTDRFAGAVAHGVHSMTLEDVRYYFRSDASAQNGIPSLNYDLSDDLHPVLRNAPASGYDTSFSTIAMQHVDQVLSNMDRKDYYLANYNLLEKLVHTMHMAEVWTKVKVHYDKLKASGWYDKKVCNCVTDVENNGVLKVLPFMSIRVRYPGIASGQVAPTSGGRYMDTSNQLYKFTYQFFNDWEKQLSWFNYTQPDSAIMRKVMASPGFIRDNLDHGLNHLSGEQDWEGWKQGMKSMNPHDEYELAVFLYCTLNSK